MYPSGMPAFSSPTVQTSGWALSRKVSSVEPEKLGEAMYKQQAESDAAKDAAKDDVVDAEFTEVDDDKNNKKSA